VRKIRPTHRIDVSARAKEPTLYTQFFPRVVDVEVDTSLFILIFFIISTTDLHSALLTALGFRPVRARANCPISEVGRGAKTGELRRELTCLFEARTTIRISREQRLRTEEARAFR